MAAYGRVIFYALLALIALVAVPYGTVEPWWEALFECIVFALAALWIIDSTIKKSWFQKAHLVFLPLFLLTLYAFIQTLSFSRGATTSTGMSLWSVVSADPYGTRLSAFKLLALTLAGVMLLRYTSTNRRLRALIFVVIGVGITSAFFGILRQTTQRTEGFFLPHLSPGSGYAQFINRNHFAYLMEMTLGLILGLIAGRGMKRDKVLIYLALAMPVWAALVLCNSRGGILSMLAQVLFLALLFTAVKSKREKLGREGGEEESLLWRAAHTAVFRVVLISCLVVTVFIGALWVGGESLTSRLETVSAEVAGETGRDGTQRSEIWRATWRMIKDHPLLGVGLGGYWMAISQYHEGSGEATPQQAHNDYLELLASGGVIGVALGAWFLYLLIREARRNFKSSDALRRGAALGACAGLFGVAVHSVVDFGLHVTINSLVFVTLVVMATAGGTAQDEPGRNATKLTKTYS
jgi:O-antigen ligase